jgi:hypothetical protein
VNPFSSQDITHYINIHQADLVACATLCAFLSRGLFPYPSNKGRNLHNQRDWTEYQTEGPLFMKQVGKGDRTRKIEGIAYNKPAKLSPLTIGFINVKRHVIIARPKKNKGNE